MKSSDYVTILAGALLAFVAFKTLGKGIGPIGAAALSNTAYPTLINANTVGTAAAGWQYFTDGTAIAPNGDYYYQGSLVYRAN